MSTQIAVRLSDEDVGRLDEVIGRGLFPSRAEAVRAGLRMLLREERDREIAESYRRAYAEHPQENDFAEASAVMLGEVLREREGPERR